MRKLQRLIPALLWMASISVCGQSQGRAVKLHVSSPPVLVDCKPVTQIPCMAASVTPVDANGISVPVLLPVPSELAHSITLRQENQTVSPFFANAGAGPEAGQKSNVVLLVLDISGSMNQPAPGSTSRFAALKDAVAKYLDGMQEGVDHIAIVPFESHNVVSTIRSAVYVTRKSDALAQLKALPQPAAKNNTALYQAVFSGVDSLKSELISLRQDGESIGELRPHLVVMTDGKNEVMSGDDPQLLNGDLGLQQAAAQVQASQLDVIGIGFGDRTAIDAAALQRLSKRFFYATDAASLLAALHTSRTAISHSIQMVWLLPQGNRFALMGKDFSWTPELHLQDGSSIAGDPVRWIGPATNAPVYARAALGPELLALIGVHPSTDSGWTAIIVYSLIFAAAFLIVLVLWFWVPRLVWGDRYAISLPQRSKRWSSDRSGITSAVGVQVRSSSLPNGFDIDAVPGAPIQRTASQITQIQPRGEFSRTRLTFEQK